MRRSDVATHLALHFSVVANLRIVHEGETQCFVGELKIQIEPAAVGVGVANGQQLSTGADRWGADLIQVFRGHFKAAEYNVFAERVNYLIVDDGVFLYHFRYAWFATNIIAGTVGFFLHPYLDVDKWGDRVGSAHGAAFLVRWVDR